VAVNHLVPGSNPGVGAKTFGTFMNPVLYVSCIYNLYKSADADSRLALAFRLTQCQKLLQADVDLVLFTDYEIFPLLETTNPRHRVIIYPVTDWSTWQLIASHTDLKLPDQINREKDTVDYLNLMNCKTEIMCRARDLNPNYAQYTWVDSGIFKVLSPELTPDGILLLQRRARDFVVNKIVSPGAYIHDYGFTDIIKAYPDWRFMGSILDVPAHYLDRFHEACQNLLHQELQSGLLVWEVNIWSSVSRHYPEWFGFYKADHDFGMFEYGKYIQ
jgi:hypothetical protein